MDNFTLPGNRNPIRFDKGNAAFYRKIRGQGEVRYTFAMIRHYQKNRPRLSDDERSALRKEQARQLKLKDPLYFSKIGKKGREAPHAKRKRTNYLSDGSGRHQLPRPR